MTVMNIQKVCILGAGPSGLASLNELLHTSKDGTSTINSFVTSNNKMPMDPAFQVVVFEQGTDIGGTWNYSDITDPPLPGDSKPENIRHSFQVPENIIAASVDNPIDANININDMQKWNKSGIYDDLFTNVPDRMMRFSSGFDIKVSNTDKDVNEYYPFITRQQVFEYLQKYTELNNLRKYIRFNSTVEKLYKKDKKWIVNVLVTENGKSKWYMESFDAIMLCNGRFAIPFVPNIEGMNDYVNQNPGAVSHTKSYRNVDGFKNKKVLLVGTSISAIDLLQYLIPACKEVWLSSNSHNFMKQKKQKVKEGQWMSDILNDEDVDFTRCSRIKCFEKNCVVFEDGNVEKFDKILFATGYHLSYPFLNVPENYGKNYIQINSGKKGDDNYAMTKADGVYMYTFSVEDPSLAFIGIAHTPLIFMMSELGAMAVAGVWTKRKKLPTSKVQKEWCESKMNNSRDGLTMISENDLKPFIDEIYPYAAEGRINFKELIKEDEVEYARLVLKELFYRFINK